MWLAFFPSKAVGDEVSDRLGRRHQFEQQLKAFSGRFCQQKINASEIPAGSIEALDDRRLLRCGISTGLTSSQGLLRKSPSGPAAAADSPNISKFSGSTRISTRSERPQWYAGTG